MTIRAKLTGGLLEKGTTRPSRACGWFAETVNILNWLQMQQL
jgi:hypothetical protein